MGCPEEDVASLTGDDPALTERARDAARRFLEGLAPRDGAEADAVLLVVSELVTNALRHAGGVTGFGLSSGPGSVTVRVEDASDTPPRARRSEPWEPGGFGWPLVQHLAEAVRVTSGPRGKTVSAVLPLNR